MKEIAFQCRSTSQGAHTLVTYRQEGVSIRRDNVSKTGNHWTEIVTGPVGACFVLTDITNSGKHNCMAYQITEDGYKAVDLEFTGCPCEL